MLHFRESLFPVGDLETGARRLLDALADPTATATRATAEQARARQLFSADRTADAWLGLYRSLAPGPSAPPPALTAGASIAQPGTEGRRRAASLIAGG